MDTIHFNTFITITGYVGFVTSAVLILTSKVKTSNLNDLKERVEILEKELVYSKQLLETERKEANSRHVDNQKAIANLEGQLTTYKEIPLKSIASSLEKLAENTRMTEKSNGLILKTLKESALIASHAADEGGMFVKTKKANPLSVEVKE